MTYSSGQLERLPPKGGMRVGAAVFAGDPIARVAWVGAMKIKLIRIRTAPSHEDLNVLFRSLRWPLNEGMVNFDRDVPKIPPQLGMVRSQDTVAQIECNSK